MSNDEHFRTIHVDHLDGVGWDAKTMTPLALPGSRDCNDEEGSERGREEVRERGREKGGGLQSTDREKEAGNKVRAGRNILEVILKGMNKEK